MLENINTCKVFLTICKYPTKGLSIRDIAKLTSLSPPTVSKIIKELYEEGLVVIQKDKNTYKIFGNINNEKYKFLKRLFNLYQIKGLIEFLNKELFPHAIILYGSYARGEDLEDSDIDIIILRPRIKKNLDLSKFEGMFNRKIHIIFMENFEDVKHLLGLDFLVFGSIV
ncbi:MAG: hypothetical protein BXU00_00465 [Candidatus Nanoclepta minutus]|uniref:Polymerase nucleotidyl transferase domain-containing protein n=1 Tax=Candidatus Nanoclepta minutus TaxID=1940235 RepID=A0A397WND6_9ARCH|nr:MAG: hypothetical protein BXU00_00465 [Candidatus Nanoclepta minutus]